MKSSKNKRNTVPEISDPKTDTYWLLGIIALAACVRIVFALQTTDDPFRGLLFLDSRVYHLLAAEIANSNFWGSEVFFRAPLFPYILAITYKLFGLESAAIQVFHALLGIGTVVLTYLIANIHFGRRVARIAGICTALYPTLYFFELSLMPTALEVFTFTAAVYCLSRYQKNRTNVALAIAGIVLGLAALSRPTILSYVLVLPLWLWLLERKQNWKSIATKMIWVVVPMAIVILPVTIRNYMIEPDLVMISSQGGANFFIGNNQNADGQTVSFPFGQTPLNRYEDHIWSASQFIAESKLRRELTSAEVSDYWFDQGMQFVTSHPADAIGLFVRKSYYLFCGEELFNNTNPLAPREYSQLYALSIWQKGINFPFGIVAPLFLVGSVMLLIQRDKRWLLLFFVASQAATIALFFVSSRFRQPFLPIMIIIAVFCGIELYNWIRSKSWRRVAAYSAALALLVFALNPPFEISSRQNRSMYHALLGGALATQERYPEAVDQLREAIKIADDNATAFQLLGSLYVKSGQLEQALAVLHRAEELAPDAIQTKSVLARIYYDRRDYERALSYFQTVLKSGMPMDKFNFWAAHSAFELGQLETAQGYLESALQENPADKDALNLQLMLRNRQQSVAP